VDISTIVGIVLGLVMVLFGIISSASVSAITESFIDIPSLIITIGGTVSCLIASYNFKDLAKNLKGASIAFKDPKLDHASVITKIIELSNVARKEGLLALEEVAGTLEDEFMKKGILLIVDGTEPELVRGIMETELANMDDRHRKVSGFWDYVAAMGPAWGMIGTLIGLVNMLAKLDDISTVGPNMAVALITTLYGSLVANWIATPIANKLKSINNNEYQMKEIVIEGLLSIQAGENPRVIEEKLKSFLAPGDRQAAGTEEGAGGEA
jgi:chemotaxis protein MotA